MPNSLIALSSEKAEPLRDLIDVRFRRAFILELASQMIPPSPWQTRAAAGLFCAVLRGACCFSVAEGLPNFCPINGNRRLASQRFEPSS
jgi:hypothetical protein